MNVAYWSFLNSPLNKLFLAPPSRGSAICEFAEKSPSPVELLGRAPVGLSSPGLRGREAFCTVFRKGELEADTYLIPMAELEEHASKFTLAVSAEPLAGIPVRTHPRAQDLLALPDDLPGWQTQQPLEPIYLREPVAAK